MSESQPLLAELLPQSAQNLVRLIGLADTVRLIEQLGGTTFPVARGANKLGKLRQDLLIEAVGETAAQKITAEYGGEALYIPNCAAALRAVRNREIHSRFDASVKAGLSANETVARLARAYRLSDRRVWDILKVLPDTHAEQPGLFE